MVCFRFLLVTIATSATLAVGACATSPPARTAAQYSADAAINARVEAAVFGTPGVHANDIMVSTYNGKVRLSGAVDTSSAVVNATNAAHSVQGVKQVDVNIQVRSQE